MSFDIFGYKPKAGESEAEFLDRYRAADEFTGEDLTTAELEKIDRLLVGEEFSSSRSENGASYELALLQVNVSRQYIFMTVPYWDTAADSIDEAVRISTLLYHEIGLFFYDPQMNKLITEINDDAMNTFNSTREMMKRILP